MPELEKCPFESRIRRCAATAGRELPHRAFVAACFTAAALLQAATAVEEVSGIGSAPYGKSPIILEWRLDWSTHQRHAPGSDNWPITWAVDDHQYTAWGDGGGFGGSNSDGRVSLGVARI